MCVTYVYFETLNHPQCFVAVSVTGKRGVGIPIILLHDAEGGLVTVELKNGCTYRGTLDEAQDNMNMTMKVG
jgi:small nuclear ribonucleoprotein D3